jgi:hypothetical protein
MISPAIGALRESPILQPVEPESEKMRSPGMAGLVRTRRLVPREKRRARPAMEEDARSEVLDLPPVFMGGGKRPVRAEQMPMEGDVTPSESANEDSKDAVESSEKGLSGGTEQVIASLEAGDKGAQDVADSLRAEPSDGGDSRFFGGEAEDLRDAVASPAVEFSDGVDARESATPLDGAERVVLSPQISQVTAVSSQTEVLETARTATEVKVESRGILLRCWDGLCGPVGRTLAVGGMMGVVFLAGVALGGRGSSLFHGGVRYSPWNPKPV